jgi:hypothetical protein
MQPLKTTRNVSALGISLKIFLYMRVSFDRPTPKTAPRMHPGAGQRPVRQAAPLPEALAAPVWG